MEVTSYPEFLKKINKPKAEVKEEIKADGKSSGKPTGKSE
jgi:hypothetical protein